MRLAPIDVAVQRLLDFGSSSDVPLLKVGTMVDCVGTDTDYTANVANWGFAELIAVSSNGAAAILPGTLCTIDKNFRITPTLVAASMINTGLPLFVALTNFGIGSTTEQYGWALRAGICPVRFSVAATVGRVFAGTAGQATPSAAAGAQILNATTLIAGASTFTRLGTLRVGSSRVNMGSLTGVYVGQAVSGTGVPASSVVSSMDPNGTSFTIGSAIGTPVSATAAGNQTLTFTNTNYGIVQFDRAGMQGQIT